MERWARQNKEHIQLWGGYATGKAQELIRFLNSYLDEVPIVSKKISQVCSAYKKCGVKLDWIEAGSIEAKECMRSSFSAVFAPHQLTNSFAYSLAQTHRRQAHIALATGWTGLRPLSCSISFPLSDHADFEEILTYCQQSGASKIFIAHGKNDSTAKELQKFKIHAKPLSELKTMFRQDNL
jgi:putative mRNA 3-end processing factor